MLLKKIYLNNKIKLENRFKLCPNKTNYEMLKFFDEQIKKPILLNARDKSNA